SVTSTTYNQLVVGCQEGSADLVLAPPVEPDVSVGHPFGRPGGVVDSVVVMAAQEDTVLDVGRASGAPGGPVVGLGPGAGDVAACGATSLVAQEQGLALGCGVQASCSAEVEDLGGSAEDG